MLIELKRWERKREGEMEKEREGERGRGRERTDQALLNTRKKYRREENNQQAVNSIQKQFLNKPSSEQ